jgi:hypothetical protein
MCSVGLARQLGHPRRLGARNAFHLLVGQPEP